MTRPHQTVKTGTEGEEGNNHLGCAANQSNIFKRCGGSMRCHPAVRVESEPINSQ